MEQSTNYAFSYGFIALGTLAIIVVLSVGVFLLKKKRK